jgi:hypothetical protein
VTAARSLSAVAASDSAKGQSWLAIDGLAWLYKRVEKHRKDTGENEARVMGERVIRMQLNFCNPAPACFPYKRRDWTL